jgi:prevent-host-death family protein
MIITNNERGTMDILNISIAEGKKNFSKIIRASEEKNQRIIISRRGMSVAIIFPYEEFAFSAPFRPLIPIHHHRHPLAQCFHRTFVNQSLPHKFLDRWKEINDSGQDFLLPVSSITYKNPTSAKK